MANSQRSSLLLQSNDIRDALQYVCPETLCVTDIDDSAMKLAQQLGGPRWCDRYLLELQKKHQDPNQAFDELIKTALAIQEKSVVKPVEEHTSEVMHRLATRSLGLLGLTARAEFVEALTRKQLASINVHPNLGIIFARGKPKGPLLAKHVSELESPPKRVLFIEDQLKEAHCVMNAMTDLGINVVVLHYTHVQQTEFCFESSQVQLNKFLTEGILISDEEAKAMIARQKSNLKM